ncbi:hypothetical protein LINPERHAP1_LOCUS36298 [Linum perenne]
MDPCARIRERQRLVVLSAILKVIGLLHLL